MGGDAGALTLRFEGYRGPGELLSVLVREGDLAARRVPLAALAADAAALPGEGGAVAAGQVAALGALTDVWRVRLAAATGLAALDEEPADGGSGPLDLDPALVEAVAALRALAEAARARLGGRGGAPRARRLGRGEDLARARRQVEARRARREAAGGLWPLPQRVPVMHHMRRVLAGLRLRPRVPLIAAGATNAEAVAATLAGLELVRRGRARLWQRRPYARVVMLRPRAREDRGAGS